MAAQNMTEGASTGSATRTGRNWVTGTFTDRDSADRAYNSILSRGYSEKEINLLMPESMHMIMWAMSDRALPRSFRMMEGFGVHTFRLINEAGEACFVKFHWKPLLGVHSVLWDEAQTISGKDPDFHRRDLWEAIENGAFPEWEFGVQIVEEKDEHKFDFDLLDPTKLIPEELVPVQRIGKLTLNRNPDNFFAETEQVAFHVGHVVPGIDFSNDPLLQGRLFSYTDTQLIRLGGPNFHEIPINRPVAPVHNNQRDGHMRQTINRSRASYEPNSIGGGCPFQAGGDMGGFTSYAEKIDASKVRARSESFFDHFSQATMFYRSQSEPEQNHIVKALRFELGKLEIPAIKERMVGLLSLVDQTLASHAAEELGLSVPEEITPPINHSIPADGPADSDVARFQPKRPKKSDAVGVISPALSMANTPKDSIKTRKVAFLVADGFDDAAVLNMAKAIEAAGAMAKFVARRGGTLQGAKGKELTVDFSLLTTSSALFDAVYVPGGAENVKTLLREADAIHFINEAYKHCKTIAATGEGIDLLRASYAGGKRQVGEGAKNLPTLAGDGIIVRLALDAHKVANDFIAAIAQHRHWSRRQKGNVPA
jgi:catalase